MVAPELFQNARDIGRRQILRPEPGGGTAPVRVIGLDIPQITGKIREIQLLYPCETASVLPCRSAQAAMSSLPV